MVSEDREQSCLYFFGKAYSCRTKVFATSLSSLSSLTSTTKQRTPPPMYCPSKKARVKGLSGDRQSNVLLGVPIMIPERAGGSKNSKETEDTAEVESNGCQSGTGIRACIDKGCLQAGKTEMSTRTLKVLLTTISEGRQRLVAYQRSHGHPKRAESL